MYILCKIDYGMIFDVAKFNELPTAVEGLQIESA